MLRTSDMDSFLKVQVPKICGLENVSIFNYKPISFLPSNATLLISIWSYCHKRHPNGELLKYEARLFVDGLSNSSADTIEKPTCQSFPG